MEARTVAENSSPNQPMHRSGRWCGGWQWIIDVARSVILVVRPSNKKPRLIVRRGQKNMCPQPSGYGFTMNSCSVDTAASAGPPARTVVRAVRPVDGQLHPALDVQPAQQLAVAAGSIAATPGDHHTVSSNTSQGEKVSRLCGTDDWAAQSTRHFNSMHHAKRFQGSNGGYLEWSVCAFQFDEFILHLVL